MIRIPVQNPDGSPVMPTKASRVRRWVKQGKATEHWNDADLYYVRLVAEPCPNRSSYCYIKKIFFFLS
ncbi:MAG: hypothetical protein F6K24_44200 [Okeania sp. SIO2D1]|nr:hypothetical protein [Okeania sp. SIO2D1]